MFTNLMMIFAGLNETVPINPVSYLSVFWPVMHILYAASSPNLTAGSLPLLSAAWRVLQHRLSSCRSRGDQAYPRAAGSKDSPKGS